MQGEIYSCQSGDFQCIHCAARKGFPAPFAAAPFLALGRGAAPVSYTHLDVYKRQTTDSLTIRKDASSDSEKVGSITDNGVYTIVEERQGAGASKWGKLKSGVGWISLDFVKEL